jgi:diguanylate cyclase (GGDEF)-like protein
MTDPKSLPLPLATVLERIFADAPEYLVILDPEMNVVLAGSSFRHDFGLKEGRTVSFLDTIERFSLSKVREVFAQLKEDGKGHHPLDVNHRTAEGGTQWVSYSWVACMDEAGSCRAFVGLGRKEGARPAGGEDVAGLKEELDVMTSKLERRAKEIARLRQELQRQASRDDMTELGNRRFLIERLEIESARARRYDQPLTMILFDVDRMTAVNDAYGQEKGDEVIREVARVVKEQVRASDVAGRYGGEEFLILCPHTDRASAQFLAERLRRRVAELSFAGDGEEFGITVSVGLVTVTGQNEFEVEALLQAAEQAVESAKQSGMNRVRVLEVV